MTDKQTPPDWVLIEAAKRSYLSEELPSVRARYWTFGAFHALCDMIEKYEQPPVDRKVLCAREALAQSLGGDGFEVPQRILAGKCDDMHGMDTCIRAIELWEGGYGK